MSEPRSLLIIGASHAGVELALSARQQGWSGPITLLGDEPVMPYHRPPLSKAWLGGDVAAEAMALRPATAFETAGITLRLATRVQAIDRVARAVLLGDGTSLPYDRLALCTGGRPRPLTLAGLTPGVQPPNLHYLRTQADALAIRAGLLPGARLVIVGGGYVGLEVAASARKGGVGVTLLEAQPRVLARVTGPELSAFFLDLHRSQGVDIRLDTGLQQVECGADGRVQVLVCSDGSRIEADQVVVGIGMLPNTELAQAAGLAVDRGVLVDSFSRTSDPLIVAAGDCTEHDSALYGRRLRLESVPNALEQARAAAATLCDKPRANESIPWFWSDQYELKLQMVGLSEGYDQCIVRGSAGARSLCAFYLRRGQLIAADAVNRPADFMLVKRLLAAMPHPDPQALADESRPLKDVLQPLAAVPGPSA